MRTDSKERTALFVLLWLSLPTACSNTVRFERVEHFPSGMQTDTWASAWVNDIHPTQVSEQFDARYAEAWQAAQIVSARLEGKVEKPETIVDEDAGRIRITDDNEVLQDVAPEASHQGSVRRPGASRLTGWKDEFLIQVVAVTDGQTRVTVSRTVLALPRFRFCIYVAAMCKRGTYEAEVSNGQIENWVLTQIANELARDR